MQKYGIIENGKLITNDAPLDGYKPVVYASIPAFDQTTQYVTEDGPIDNGDHISVGVTINTMPASDNSNGMFM